MIEFLGKSIVSQVDKKKILICLYSEVKGCAKKSLFNDNHGAIRLPLLLIIKV